MWKRPAKPELDVAPLHSGRASHRPRSLLPPHSPSTEELRSPASFPPLPAPWEERKGAESPLVTEVRRGTGCSQVQIIGVIITVLTISRGFGACSALCFVGIVSAPPHAAPGGGTGSPLRWWGRGIWKLELGAAGLVCSATQLVPAGVESELESTWA